MSEGWANNKRRSCPKSL